MSSKITNSGTVDVEPHEIKDATVIFSNVWRSLEHSTGRKNLWFPKELLLLGGAPGAGKGTQTKFILKSRGLICKPIVVSKLLNTPEVEVIKSRGQLVGDTEVIELVFRELLKEDYQDGALLDGFPRTQVQVECLKLLVEKINELYYEFSETELAIRFRQPTIHAILLFVGEQTSIGRQLYRGVEIGKHNEKVEEAGIGQKQDLRDTDIDPKAAAERYRVFKEQTWNALQSLKEIYHYHFINAEGKIDQVEQNILEELRYQSSLELDRRTYDRIRSIPISSDITTRARQELIKRLDDYELNHTEMFKQVIGIINEKFMPIILRHAVSGVARVRTEETIFNDPTNLAMVIDVFSERGYQTLVDKNVYSIPKYFDLQSGKIECEEKPVYHIQVIFQGSQIRRG